MTLSYNTYREIRQQPMVWCKAYDIILSQKDEIKAFLDRFQQEGYEIVLTGAGTSGFIGDALVPALFSTRFRGARSIATTDIVTSPEAYFDSLSKVLLISFARSGNSPESLGAIKAVEKTAGKAAHIFITCNEQGHLAQQHGDNILTILLPPETNDLSLAMTSSYSTMLLACSLIANIDDIESQKPLIEKVADCTLNAMDAYEEDICTLSGKDFKRAVFLGTGPLRGVAEESSLKLQELTDGTVICCHDSFLGFRHGPKAVINNESLMVYLVSPKPSVQRYELDLIRQIKAHNGVKGSIAICGKNPGLDPAGWDIIVETGLPEDIPACYGCVSYIFVAQMLGLFKSMQLGLNPDSPSVSGNISRVVEGVTLYI